jgi:hypothetical protein
MPQQIDLNPIQYQAAQVSPVDSSAFVQATGQLIDTAAFIAERSAFQHLQKDVSALEQSYQNDKQADAKAFADVRAKLAEGSEKDADTAELQAQAVKLAAKLRQGGNSLDYVTKLQLATKQAKMRAPWAADKLEATFQKYIGSEGSSMIFTDYQASQKMQQQYQQQLLADASEMGLHPADPYLEEKVMQGKAEAYKLNMRTKQLAAAGAEDEVMSREVINTALTGMDNQVESVVSVAVEQFGSLDAVPVEQKTAYLQQIRQFQANARLYIEGAVTRRGLLKYDKEHLSGVLSAFNSKLKLIEESLSGKVSSEIFKDGLSAAENATMLDLYGKDPALAKAILLMSKAPTGEFSTKIMNNKLAESTIRFIQNEYPADAKERAATIDAVTRGLQAKETPPEVQAQFGSAIVDALDKGVRSPGTMTVADRDMLINAYRNPKAKQYFDTDPAAIPVLERAVQYKMYQEIPGVLRERYDAAELKQVQANVSTDGTVTFVPLQVAGGDFERARSIASELNSKLAPNINNTLNTWAAYSGEQGKITINPYSKLRNIMPVLGVEDVVLDRQQSQSESQPAPVIDNKPSVRRVLRGPDGSFMLEGDNATN